MGRNKGLVKFDGEALILRTARIVEPLVSSVTVIGPVRPYRRLGLVALPDKIPGLAKLPALQGPLVGILTALSASSTPWNLVLACDLPYLSREFVEKLIARAIRANAQAYLVSTAGGLEPLAAVYRRDAYDRLTAAFADGVRKVTEALTRVSMTAISVESFGESAAGGLVLKNMNTQEELAAAKSWWRKKRVDTEREAKSLKKKLVKKSRAPRLSK